MRKNNNWLKRNQKNLIFIAIVAIIVIGVLELIPSAKEGLQTAWVIMVSAFTLFYLITPGIAGYYIPKVIDAFEIDKALRIVSIVVLGFVLPIAFVYGLSLLTYNPILSTAYDTIFPGVANFHEVPLASWGWYGMAFVFYFLGWLIGWTSSSY